jgi:hypothetical protein
VEQAWPARLKARPGRPVQNYGTAGSGRSRRKGCWRLLSATIRCGGGRFFAGNDIFNAESFDDFIRPDRERPRPPAWRPGDTVARFDGLYLVSLVRAAADAIGKAEATSPPKGGTAPPPSGPWWSRGRR